ncbi:MAG: hypothetical protein QOG17_1628 [Gammaproteobacteria bacterium]|jgi:ElaB/YqjD/DUF883 family membrane-anchored ribosome-binding protein|nr:hypothetical protein [Gammaproteobacteria bacterium]
MPTTAEGDSTVNGSSARQERVTAAALGPEFKQLFDSVDDLIKRVADIESAEIQKIRAKVRVALMVAKSALQDGASQVRRQAMQVAATTDGYVRTYPWQSVGTATLAGLVLGLLIAGRDNDRG